MKILLTILVVLIVNSISLFSLEINIAIKDSTYDSFNKVYEKINFNDFNPLSSKIDIDCSEQGAISLESDFPFSKYFGNNINIKSIYEKIKKSSKEDIDKGLLNYNFDFESSKFQVQIMNNIKNLEEKNALDIIIYISKL